MSIVPNFSARARPVNTVFRMSPLATWFKVLARQPGLEHYAISNTAKSLVGGGSLQRFPRAEIGGRWLIPLLAHSHVWPLGRGGQFAAFTSMAYWFDAATGALLGSCRYNDNRSLQAMHEGMGPWDWTTNDHIALALPKEPVTVDFAVSEVAYTSAWTDCGSAMGVSSGGIGQGNAYVMGPEYTLGDQRVRRRVSIESGGRPGQVCYTWTTQRQREGSAAVEDSVRFWVNTAQHSIDGVECSLDVVTVDPQRNHSWVQAQSQWRRLT